MWRAAVNLKSFYFGCVVTNVVAVASAPSPCSMTVTGFRGQDQVARKTVTFTPDGFVSSLGPADLKNSGFEVRRGPTTRLLDSMSQGAVRG